MKLETRIPSPHTNDLRPEAPKFQQLTACSAFYPRCIALRARPCYNQPYAGPCGSRFSENIAMRLARFLLTIVLTLSAAALAQTQQMFHGGLQAMEALRQSAASKTEFSLDHSMLVLASRLDSNNEDLLRVIAGVSGISVHRYRFPEPWTYDPETVHALADQYHSSGWMQLLNKHDKDGLPGATNLWIHWQNEAISNIAILLARPTEVTYIEITGSISPLDLSHLGGHFGIPKIEAGIRVPNQSHR